jgi:hypothetical protein
VKPPKRRIKRVHEDEESNFEEEEEEDLVFCKSQNDKYIQVKLVAEKKRIMIVKRKAVHAEY